MNWTIAKPTPDDLVRQLCDGYLPSEDALTLFRVTQLWMIPGIVIRTLGQGVHRFGAIMVESPRLFDPWLRETHPELVEAWDAACVVRALGRMG
jgi:hypothetical protein